MIRASWQIGRGFDRVIGATGANRSRFAGLARFAAAPRAPHGPSVPVFRRGSVHPGPVDGEAGLAWRRRPPRRPGSEARGAIPFPTTLGAAVEVTAGGPSRPPSPPRLVVCQGCLAVRSGPHPQPLVSWSRGQCHPMTGDRPPFWSPETAGEHGSPSSVPGRTRTDAWARVAAATGSPYRKVGSLGTPSLERVCGRVSMSTLSSPSSPVCVGIDVAKRRLDVAVRTPQDPPTKPPRHLVGAQRRGRHRPARRPAHPPRPDPDRAGGHR